MHSIDSKQCLGCGVIKPLDLFSRDSSKSSGYGSKCKKCRAEKSAAYRSINAEKIKIYNQRYYDENKETLRDAAKERSRVWYRENRDRARHGQSDYYKQNRSAILESVKRWKLENRERARNLDIKSSRARRARLSAVMCIKFSLDELDARMSYFGYRCWMCGEPGVEIDHVKPISQGGAHMLGNLRPACKSCNSSKSNKWPFNTSMRAT